jgi:hypothetical protein
VNTLFERQRNNRVGNMTMRRLVKGPISSIDQSRLVYIKVSKVDKDGNVIERRRGEEHPVGGNQQSDNATTRRQNNIGGSAFNFKKADLSQKSHQGGSQQSERSKHGRIK